MVTAYTIESINDFTNEHPALNPTDDDIAKMGVNELWRKWHQAFDVFRHTGDYDLSLLAYKYRDRYSELDEPFGHDMLRFNIERVLLTGFPFSENSYKEARRTS